MAAETTDGWRRHGIDNGGIDGGTPPRRTRSASDGSTIRSPPRGGGAASSKTRTGSPPPHRGRPASGRPRARTLDGTCAGSPPPPRRTRYASGEPRARTPDGSPHRSASGGASSGPIPHSSDADVATLLCNVGSLQQGVQDDSISTAMETSATEGIKAAPTSPTREHSSQSQGTASLTTGHHGSPLPTAAPPASRTTPAAITRGRTLQRQSGRRGSGRKRSPPRSSPRTPPTEDGDGIHQRCNPSRPDDNNSGSPRPPATPCFHAGSDSVSPDPPLFNRSASPISGGQEHNPQRSATTTAPRRSPRS